MTSSTEKINSDLPELNRRSALSVRNKFILSISESGQVPMLDFETKILQDEMSTLVESQQGLSKLLGEAMEQSSETWHDNAPADAIIASASIVANRAQSTIMALRNGSLLNYPDASEKAVTIGSLVTVEFNGGEPEQLFISGFTREIPKNLAAQIPEDVDFITINSPIGIALFNSLSNQTVSYSVNGKQMNVAIIGISQFNGSELEIVK